jgi:hypothetical protein
MRMVVMPDFAPLPRLVGAKRSRFPDELRDPRSPRQNMSERRGGGRGGRKPGRMGAGGRPSSNAPVLDPRSPTPLRRAEGSAAARQSWPRLPPHRRVCFRSRSRKPQAHTSAPTVGGSSCRSRLHRPDVYSGVLLRRADASRDACRSNAQMRRVEGHHHPAAKSSIAGPLRDE